MMMLLGTEVGLGQGHIVLDGDPPTSPKKGGMRRTSIVAHDWMDQAAT